MKTKIVIDEEIIKKYYTDLFIINVLWVAILTFLVGTIGFIYFLLKDDLVFAISLEAFTVIFIIILFLMNRNNLKIAEKEFTYAVSEYELEFDDEMKVIVNGKSKVYSYSIIKPRRLIHFVMFRVFDSLDKYVYIIPKNSFSKEDLDSLLKRIKDERRS